MAFYRDIKLRATTGMEDKDSISSHEHDPDNINTLPMK